METSIQKTKRIQKRKKERRVKQRDLSKTHLRKELEQRSPLKKVSKETQQVILHQP